MSERTTSTITLRALNGWPLAEDAIRDMVLATARAIAERTGVEIVDLTTTDTSVTATLRAGRIEAVGFAAELRRLTTTWYTKKFGEPTLWGEVPQSHDEHDDTEAGEWWKGA